MRGSPRTGAATIDIRTTAEDIGRENESSGREIISRPDDYLETLVICRKIAERMPEHDTFLFCGSCIAVDEAGYVFTAKSGTGKSTHTRLWQELLGVRATMVNDDKPLIRIADDGPVIYGTPWDGKHHLSNNIAAPLKAVCILEWSSDEATHGNTMSCIDLSQINNVKFACDGFFKDSFEKLNRDTFVEYAKARNDSLAFGDAPYDLVDIGSFVKNLSIGDTEAKQRLEDSLVSAVLHTRSKDTYATGLSIYHPYNAGYNYLRNKETYDKIAPSDEYVQYIEYFTDFLTGQAQADWSSLSTLGQLKSKEEAVRDSTTGFSLLLTDEQLSFLAEVEFHAFESTDQGQTFALVSINPEVDTDGNSLISEYVHRALFITRGEGNDMLVLSEALPYDVISDKLYSMRATLIGHDASGDEVRQGIRLEFTFDETNSMVELLQLLALDSDGTYTTRHSIDPDDYEAIEFIRELRRPTSYSDSDTTLLSYDQWELVEARPYVMSLSEDWDLQMLHDTLNRDDLYVAFAFRDYQNYRYNSSLIRVAARPDKTNVLLLYDNSNCAVSIPYPKASAQGMRVNFRLTNKSDVESAILCVDNLRLNGRPTGLSMEVYGNAANDGMGIGEEQVGMLLIKAKLLEGLGTVTTMDFDIVIINALTDEVVYTEPVHGELEFDVSAFG